MISWTRSWMVIHILLVVKVVTLNRKKADELASESCLTEILNKQTVSDINRTLVKFLEEFMNQAKKDALESCDTRVQRAAVDESAVAEGKDEVVQFEMGCNERMRIGKCGIHAFWQLGLDHKCYLQWPRRWYCTLVGLLGSPGKARGGGASGQPI